MNKLGQLLLLLFLPLMMSTEHAYAQIKSFFTHYSSANGLPDNMISCIYKDSENFMWFGSWSGLIRYDGHQFMNFKSKPGDNSVLKNERIVEIFEDAPNFLWIRTFDDNIFRFDKRTQEFYPISAAFKMHNLPAVSFKKILSVGKNIIWLQTDKKELYHVSYNDKGDMRPEKFDTKFEKKGALVKVNFLKADSKGDYWLGTNMGVSLIKKDKHKDIYKSHIIPPLTGVICRDVYINNDKSWLCTNTGSVYAYDNTTGKTEKIYAVDHPLRRIHVSHKKQKIYATTDDGYLILADFYGTPPKEIRITPGEKLYSIFEDSRANLWLEPEVRGIIRFDTYKNEAKLFTQENVTNHHASPEDYKVFEDGKNRVWAVLKQCGFGYFDETTQKFEHFYNDPKNPNNKFSNLVTASYYDPAGVLWLVSYTRGIEKIIFQQNDFNQHFIIPNSVYTSDNEVRGMYTDSKNRLWMGTKAGKLTILKDGETPITDLFINAPRIWPQIYTILEDSRGRVWMGTKGDGLIKATPTNDEHSKYKVTFYPKDNGTPYGMPTDVVYTLLEDMNGQIWGGSYDDGPFIVEETANSTKFISINNRLNNYPGSSYLKIRHMNKDVHGVIWMGTTEGLVLAKPTKGSRYSFCVYRKIPGNIHSLGSNDIQYICKGRGDTMWLCTSSSGLNKAFSSNPMQAMNFENYGTKDGMPSDYVLSCVADNNFNLWLATQNGVSRFTPETKKFQNFGIYDGLPLSYFSEASCGKLSSGKIVLGSFVGYFVFNPDKIGAQKVAASLALTNLQVNSKNISPGDKSILKNVINNTDSLVLNYDQNIISIDYSVLDYRSVENDNYLYRLSGFDNHWQVSNGSGRATYTNIPPGSYTFEVKGQTQQRYVHPLSRQLHITILPPPWKTWWAYSLYCITAVGFILFIRRTEIRMLRLRQRVALDNKMTELKLSFFTQVSHELRTPLTLIESPSREVLETEQLSPVGREHMKVVLKNARRMVRLVNQLLDLRKAQSGKATLKLSHVSIVDLVTSITEYFKDIEKSRSLTIAVQTDTPEQYLWLDTEKMDIILYNLLGNAIKFSPDGGLITIAILKTKANTIEISVSDEGCGVPEGAMDHIFELFYEADNHAEKHSSGSGIGLALSKELVMLHKGSISAQNNASGGLTVTITLQEGNAHFKEQHVQYLSATQESKPEIAEETQFGVEQVLPHQQDRPLVLLVEDNEDLRNFLAHKLKEQYNVIVAANGQEGLNQTYELKPDLILSDIMMPIMDGIKLLDTIKNDEETSHIPVILLTAKHSVESQIEGLKYGADYYITKPFEMDFLQTAISSLIDRRKKIVASILSGKLSEKKDTSGITEYDQDFLAKTVAFIEEKMEDSDFNIEEVANAMFMSRSVFFRKLKSLTNVAPVEFVRDVRLEHAKKLFDKGETNITSAAYAVGFNNPKYFSTCFKAKYNKTPTEYLKEMREVDT